MNGDVRKVDCSDQPAPGSLADMVPAAEAVRPSQRVSPESLVRMFLLIAFVAVMNLNQFPMMYRDWRDNPNWSHGFMIPLFSLWLIYSRRHELLTAPRRMFFWGLPLLVIACLAQITGYAIRNPWSCQLAMLLVLLCLVLYLCGPKFTRYAWLPILFLAFAMPVPDRYYQKVSLPMQNFAAKGSAAAIRLFGTHVNMAEDSSTLNVQTVSGDWRKLTVEEACAGVRMLMAFLALAVALAYLEDRPLWQRVVMVLMGIPIAIACNMIRVCITCAAFIWDHEAFGQKFMHGFTGMLMLMPALLMLWLLGKLLNRLYVEEDDEPVSKDPSAESTK